MLNTGRLQPCSKTTKYCQLQVAEHGVVQAYFVDGVLLQFHQDQVVVIRSASPKYRPQQTFTPSQMGPDMRDRFEHVYRQIQSMRAREPKIVYYTKYCKCELMENLPADFVCSFHPEIVADFDLHFSRGSKFLKLGINGYDCFMKLREKDLKLEFAELVLQNVDVFRELNPNANTGPLMDTLFPFLLHAYNAMQKVLGMEANPQKWKSKSKPAAALDPTLDSSLQTTLWNPDLSHTLKFDASFRSVNTKAGRSVGPRSGYCSRPASQAPASPTAGGPSDPFPLIIDERRKIIPRDPIRLPL